MSAATNPELPRISVAILTRNRRARLEQSLLALARQSPPLAEVLVVDTGSTDDTRAWLDGLVRGGAALRNPPDSDIAREAAADLTANPDDPAFALLRLPLRWIPDDGRGAFAGARNRACEALTGDLLAFVDDDVEVDANWSRRAAARFAADSTLAVLGGVTLPAEPLPVKENWAPECNWMLGLSTPGAWGPEAGRVALGDTSNIVFRRSAWAAVRFQEVGAGGFKAGGAAYLAGREDATWWRALRRAGCVCELDGRLIAWHHIDPARCEWTAAAARSQRDGEAAWSRAAAGETTPLLRAAVADCVNAPVRLIESMVRPGISPGQAAAAAALWTVRQGGLARMATLANRRGRASEGRLAAMGVVEAARAAVGTAKRIARTASVVGHHQLRPDIRPLPTPANPPRALLLISCGFLGDQLLIQPALRRIRAAYPKARIVLLASAFGDELYGADAPAPERALIDEVARLDADAPIPARHRRLQALLAAERPDAVGIFYGHGLWAMPLFLPFRLPIVGFDRDMGFRQQLWTDLQTHIVSKNWNIHETANHLRIAAALGAMPRGACIVPEPFTITIPDDVQRRVDELLSARGLRSGEGDSSGGGAPFITIHPGVGLGYKYWPTSRWYKVARWISRHTQYRVALVGGRDLRPLAEKFQRAGLPCESFCGDLSLRATAALLRRTRILLTGDSGPKHLAFAVGAPTLTIYGPSDERRWGPVTDAARHIAVRRGLADLTHQDLYGLPPNHALLQIQAADVVAALKPLLA